MTISELIEQLEKIKKEHGDIDVEYEHNDGMYLLDTSSAITDYRIDVGSNYLTGDEYKTLVLF